MRSYLKNAMLMHNSNIPLVRVRYLFCNAYPSCSTTRNIKWKYVWVWKVGTCNACLASQENLWCMSSKWAAFLVMQKRNLSCVLGIRSRFERLSCLAAIASVAIMRKSASQISRPRHICSWYATQIMLPQVVDQPRPFSFPHRSWYESAQRLPCPSFVWHE